LLDEVGEDDGGLLGKLGAMFMEDPAKLPLMVQSIQGVLSMFTTQTKQTGQPVALGAVTQPKGDALLLQDTHIMQVVEVLKKKDPQLLQHLTKLASLPDPVFKQLVSMLDTM